MHTFVRKFSVSCCFRKEVARNLKGKSKSSQDWLIRQLKDPYIEKAKVQNYRCRSAFKLLEINEKFNILRPGYCVVDIGAAPGSWTQVAVNKTNSLGKDAKKDKGFVVSLDRQHLFPVDGAVLISGIDFTQPEAETKLIHALGGRDVDVVLSDMAPNASGVKSMDHDAIISLVRKVLKFGVQISKNGASILLKVWVGRLNQDLEKEVAEHYESVKWVKPKSSRSDSAEIFILGNDLKKREKG